MNERDKSLFKNLITTQAYIAMKDLADAECANWGSQIPSGDTDFIYLRNAFERDGKQMGVRAFLSEIERIATL